MIEVKDDNGNIIAFVEYNDNLYVSDFSVGATCELRGLTKLKNRSYVLIYGTDCLDKSNFTRITTKERAVVEILKSDNIELLDEPRFEELKEFAELLLQEEEE